MRSVSCAKFLQEEGEYAKMEYQEGFRKMEEKGFTKHPRNGQRAGRSRRGACLETSGGRSFMKEEIELSNGYMGVHY